ncbi:MAG: DNA mismatch repair protein MutS [Oligoflexia bacterium]|nr:DNA mismatch repair protein MutS [Oligoflexia bacterium]
MATGEEATTPLMKQYWDLKAQAGDALLLFRMGDFYELFGDDAVEASRILEITLTSRDKNKANPIPMAGVPHHALPGYLPRLLRANKKVAIGEQMEDPSKVTGKAIVRREITRVFTPAVQFDNEGFEANYLAAVAAAPSANGPAKWALACLDASTGETLVSDAVDAETLVNELGRLPVRHLLRFPDSGTSEVLRGSLEALQSSGAALVEELPSNTLAPTQAVEALKRHYQLESLDAFLPCDAAAHALGLVLHYTLRTQKQERLAHLRLPLPLHRPRAMVLGPRSPQHLDLIPSPEGGPNLYQLINRTRCALGARQLKQWLLSPLKAPEEIAERQEAVREISSGSHLTARLGEELAKVYDLERLSGRINARLANPRDTLALGHSLATLAPIASLLELSKTAPLRQLHSEIAGLARTVAPLYQRILGTQREEAPLVSRDGGIFNPGTSPELDHLLSLSENGQRWLIDLEAREREATGIASLKVRYNRVFGYYIEITQAHLKSVPAHYQRKQTTVGAERFFTEELKKFEDDFVNASARQKALEQQLFEELVSAIQQRTAEISIAARCLAELDALLSLSRLAGEPGWIFPVIDDSLELDIKAGRHPLVDQAAGGRTGSFVPNDLRLSPSSRLTLMITGPNMGGKSTAMRQTALIVLLGQIGAPVPAAEARWGAVSAIHTRIGAHDAIARGQSTFMVEMSELAHILHHADERSLIILDEIGRGTSTYDGISVAWATLEWLCALVRARTLFATHYHELTRLTGTLPLLANAHMAVEGAKGALRFLYKLREGPANESFGIHVAKSAGLPKLVIDRAWEVLDELERHAAHGGAALAAAEASPQLSLFADGSSRVPKEPGEAPPALMATPPEPHPALIELGSVDVNQLTPVQALNLLSKLQEMARAD